MSEDKTYAVMQPVSYDDVYICEPCSSEKVSNEAKHYCQDCGQKICDACKNNHMKFPAMRNHTISPVSKNVAIICGCNKNQQVAFYCITHQNAICSPCKSFQHQDCETSSIKEKCPVYKPPTFERLLSQTTSLKNKYEQLKKEAEGTSLERKQLKDACIKELKTLRNELDALEKRMHTELDQWELVESARDEPYISALTTALDLLKTDLKLLEDVKRDGREASMFIADVQVSKTIKGYESRMQELKKTGGEYTKKFLSDLKSSVALLGSLTPGNIYASRDDASTKTCHSEETVLLGRKVQTRNKDNINAGDEKASSITGCAVMATGDVILSDTLNQKIRKLSSTGVLTGNLKLSSRPWDVSVLDSTSVIATLPDEMQLQIVQVLPEIKTGRIIKLDKKCWGVKVFRDDVYVTCHNDPGEGEVKVVGLNGEDRRRLGLNEDKSFMFTGPYYITVNRSGDKIFVTDENTHAVICMCADGNVIYNKTYLTMSRGTGLLCDVEDNILVCGRLSHNVLVIGADGNLKSSLLTESDWLKEPMSCAYRDIDNTLLVGCHGSNSLLSFQLK